MTGMDDLIAYIRRCLDDRERQLDEDERVALAAHPGPWELSQFDAMGGPAADVLIPLSGSQTGAKMGLTRSALLGTQDADTAAHIARQDPARTLARIEAERADIAMKRRILDAVLPKVIDMREVIEQEWGGQLDLDAEDLLLLALAQPYAGREGWREEWAA